MGNGYHHHLQHHQNLNNKSTYLPIWCSRPSIKDVHLSKWHDNSNPTSTSTTSSSSSSYDPSSPRVSCVGQVKIRNNKTTNNIGYPTPPRLTQDNYHNNIRSSSHSNKLKRLFSTKNLTTTSTSLSCTRQMIMMHSARRPSKCRDDNYGDPIDAANMDPPLPVIKRVQQQPREVNIWKRRSSAGVALKSLQIQQIHIPNNHFLQPTTVRSRQNPIHFEVN